MRELIIWYKRRLAYSKCHERLTLFLEKERNQERNKVMREKNIMCSFSLVIDYYFDGLNAIINPTKDSGWKDRTDRHKNLRQRFFHNKSWSIATERPIYFITRASASSALDLEFFPVFSGKQKRCPNDPRFSRRPTFCEISCRMFKIVLLVVVVFYTFQLMKCLIVLDPSHPTWRPKLPAVSQTWKSHTCHLISIFSVFLFSVFFP